VTGAASPPGPSGAASPPMLSEAASPADVRAAAAHCTRCPLYAHATQTVFGEGDVPAEVVLVGEQPGDREDLEGRPFVGPAGQLLDRALIDAGIDRTRVYVTNAVKHFKWEPRGKRRIHKKPAEREIAACFPWLEEEIRRAHPRVVVCLGATASQALLGRQFRVTASRGALLSPPAGSRAADIRAERSFVLLPTVHPSSLLRTIDEAERAEAYRLFVADLKIVHRALGAPGRR